MIRVISYPQMAHQHAPFHASPPMGSMVSLRLRFNMVQCRSEKEDLNSTDPKGCGRSTQGIASPG